MKRKIERKFIDVVKSLIKDTGFPETGLSEADMSALKFQQLAGDGSSRQFVRVSADDRALCLAVAPGEAGLRKWEEARSARMIGRYLYGLGVPVPDQYGYDEETGIILFEDLGDVKLHDRVIELKAQSRRADYDPIYSLYCQVIEQMIPMQIRGGQQFDPSWCWDTSRYDSKVMVDNESGYFCRSFLQDLTGASVAKELTEEFVELARICAEEEPVYFLHRDMQSRNIMIKDGRIRFIDFQGGRLGPLQYDIASLLIDPYVGLPGEVQAKLLDYYIGLAEEQWNVNGVRLKKYYPYLALQRNLQIIGAFSFLGYQRNKHFFRQFLHPSLLMLENRLSSTCFDLFPKLRSIVRTSVYLLQNDAKFIPID